MNTSANVPGAADQVARRVPEAVEVRRPRWLRRFARWILTTVRNAVESARALGEAIE